MMYVEGLSSKDILPLFLLISAHLLFLLLSKRSEVNSGRFILFLGVLSMNCKDCTREKHCKQKKNRPQNCERFLKYSESKKFESYDKMMRQNHGINLD